MCLRNHSLFHDFMLIKNTPIYTIYMYILNFITIGMPSIIIRFIYSMSYRSFQIADRRRRRRRPQKCYNRCTAHQTDQCQVEG